MSRYFKASVAAAAVAATAMLFTGTAAAQPSDDPVSGDDRATAHAGNKVGKDCATLFPGSHEITGDLTTDEDKVNLDVTGVADGIEVVAVIVKGSPGYNVYEPADLGELPWLDLHSPIAGGSGKPAEISHWFACGIGTVVTTTTQPTDTTTTEPTETTETTVETTTPDESSPTATTTDESSSEVAVTTTTTSADVAPAAEDEDLASTGFNGGWLIALGAILLLGGGAVLLLLRARGARS